ncbi:dTMP kinase, partial [Streptomyces sp. NPDC059701]
AGPGPAAPPAADGPRRSPAAPDPSDALTVPTPVVTPADAAGGSAEDTAVLRPVRDARDVEDDDAGDERGTAGDRARGRGDDDRASGVSESEVTTELPVPPVPSGAADETAVLPAVDPRAADETAVLPPVTPGAADETAVLPPVRGDDPADRVPPGYFREEGPAGADRSGEPQEITRELPQVDPDQEPPRRRRSDWAEETPLDDLPTLADELLGPRDDDRDDDRDKGRDSDGGGRRRGRGRR